MADLLLAGWVGNMVVTSLLQIIGFFSSAWFCNIDKYKQALSDDSCEIQGLFHASEIVDEGVFWLCTISGVVSLVCTVIAAVVAYVVRNYDDVCGVAVSLFLTVSGIFLFCQFLAGVANLIMFHRYDVLGWSAIVFFTFALPAVGILFLVVAICCCYICKDD